MTEEKKEYKAEKPKGYELIVDKAMNRITQLQTAGQIHFPRYYSPQNALQSAWLILQETKDKDKNLVLESCTQASIANSLLDMVISGLNPAKKQGYFIAYGKQLSFQRSYFGSMALAKRLDPNILDIIAEVVFEEDVFEFEVINGYRRITKHKQTIESIDSGKPKAAYCQVIGKHGVVMKTDLMSFEQIKKAWSKSKMNPVLSNGDIKPGSTHSDYLVEMCKKTVINRACKPIINSSSDKTLLESVNRAEFTEAEEEAAMQIAEKANKEPIDVEPVNTGAPLAKSGVEDTETTPAPVELPIKPEPENEKEYPTTFEPEF